MRRPPRNRSRLLMLLAGLTALAACGSPSATPEPEASLPTVDEAPTPEAIQTGWWEQLADLCGNAYDGRLVSADPSDAELADQPMVMHVRRCTPTRIEVPFHIGDDHSRTWVLTRTETGIQLEHDHRHEDGSPDVVTLYGGHTVASGTETEQFFPADRRSKTLFEANDLAASVANVWSMEIVPGARFTYNLRRPERFFRADFDLSQTVEPPPAPWGAE